MRVTLSLHIESTNSMIPIDSMMYITPLQTSTNATLTMVGVPRLVPTLLALSCAAVEVDSNLQAMDWAVMVWYCYQMMERGGGNSERTKPVCLMHKILYSKTSEQRTHWGTI